MVQHAVLGSILVVSTDEESLRTLAEILEPSYRVATANSADAALIVMNSSKPDFVLTDLDLPDSSGVAFCKKLQTHPNYSDVPVILIVEASQIDEMVEGFAAGAVEYISKPFHEQEVLVRLNNQLKKKASQLDGVEEEPPVAPEVPSIDSASFQAYRKQLKHSILLVDDYSGNIEVLKTILQDEYDVFTAASGREALDVVAKEDIDLILLDVMMPDMDGYEVCARLKEQEETEEIPVIFITALDEVEDEAKGLEMGAIDYITKPFSLSIVRARIRNHIELVRHRDILKSFSFTDGLTRLPNRRQFDEVLNREWHRAERERQELAVMLVDVDNFKRYNDYYGHIEGDECLKKVAAALAKSCHRVTDFVARYGGEEFAAVFPNTNIEGAHHMAETMLEAIRDLQIPHKFNGEEGIVTVSMGVASCHPKLNTKSTELLQEADKYLYMAKEAGRNRVISPAFKRKVRAPKTLEEELCEEFSDPSLTRSEKTPADLSKLHIPHGQKPH